MSWNLKGTVVLACNCDYGCPCNFNALPTHGKCEGGWVWMVERGNFDDVDLGGLGLSLFVNWPGAIHEGNGEAIAHVDEKADERQRQALEKLVKGEAGGPWGILVVNTVSTLHGPSPAPYVAELNEYTSSVRVGDFAEVSLEPVKNPVTGDEVHPRAILPEGLIFKDGALAASRSFRVDDAISYDHTGQYAAAAPFEYAGS